jgi:hypothetical protein
MGRAPRSLSLGGLAHAKLDRLQKPGKETTMSEESERYRDTECRNCGSPVDEVSLFVECIICGQDGCGACMSDKRCERHVLSLRRIAQNPKVNR